MIAIIGNGNVASHMYNALEGKTEVKKVNSRTLEDLPDDADVILICVSDSAIEEVVFRLPQTESIVAHTAGSVGLDVLKKKFKNCGVFYPLQTFTKNIPLDYSEIPVFVEASSSEVDTTLKNLGRLISRDVREVDSEKRKQLHLASVFACNFMNALAGIAEDILQNSGVDFSTLLPLMKQTVNKLINLKPALAQTGPAVRGDQKVMKSHMDMLEYSPEYKQIYALLSSIITSHQNAKNEI